MLVANGQTSLITNIIVDRIHAFPELLGKKHTVACIDMQAIFYTHASEDTEMQDWDEYTDDTAIRAWRANDE